MQTNDTNSKHLFALSQMAALNHRQALVIDTNLSPEARDFILNRPNLPSVFADCVSASKAERLRP